MTISTRLLARAALVPAAGVLALGLAGPAAAHVTVTPSDTAAGAYAVLTMSVPHGCDGSPTTRVTISVPESIVSVTPTRNPFYDVEVVTEKLPEPITDAHGNEITERDARVVYTATSPLPDHQRDALELSVKLPDEEGLLAFPTVQTCEEGETAWTQVAADGDDEELDTPAPVFEVTAADSGEPLAESEPAAATSADDGDGDGRALGVAGLAAGLLGLVLGGLALARTRTRT
ncbi:YcnI family protein [Nocardioides sp. SYSU D00038]|uniref:YcnI family copper-binding membrane protein n=1 Tax=Nocardioides sp. SYSU D00038 TaxID=2812554 RepID=UPI0019679BBB|nr:YcnI family protein [Nocardioides sp. SYSU D00038]